MPQNYKHCTSKHVPEIKPINKKHLLSPLVPFIHEKVTYT